MTLILRKAIKDYICDTCGNPIPVSSLVRAGYDRGWRHKRFCSRCVGFNLSRYTFGRFILLGGPTKEELKWKKHYDLNMLKGKFAYD